ncbi:hypothetical protein P5G63_19785 [Aeromonas salmonicida]|uniref:Uncharacterized protein n=1 Tax=Aeromonas bestiarum TaxID=105751 RepID=A0AAW7I3T3_9GAMM|nr:MULTISPECIES: hypothetical protein [Aeromonas]MDF8330606.1 hypothetical protein [Aeromonas salmonicida]MDM5138437.1 hypothetical protein [Aeromonas bestiarum]
MYLLAAVVLMMLAGVAMSTHFALGILPFLAAWWCFSQSTRQSLETFLAFAFILILIGFVLNVVVANW